MTRSPDSWKDHLISEIMPAREVHLFAGPSGAGKTTLLVQALKDFVDGKEFFGRRTFPAPVLYVSCDRTLDEQKRVMDRTGTAFDTFPCLVLDEICPAELTPTIDMIISYVIKLPIKPKLLVLDGFAVMVPDGKHSDYSTVLKYIRKCQHFCQKHDITILGVLHFAKEKKGETYSNQRERILGSTAWGGFSNLVMTLAMEDPEEDKNFNRILWICPRQGRQQKLKLTMNTSGRLIEVEEAAEDDLATILEFEMKKLPLDKEFQRKEFVEMGGRLEPSVSPSTVDRLLKRLLSEGVWEKGSKAGRYRRVSEA